jgi:2-polyprenyl-6-methoxyphenol hydroxylase-like FAD-dependent oxidoreductase
MVLKIGIVGAGPAGLTLANILYRNGITATIYERESSRNARSQGGSLDLHPLTGQAALEACGLTSEFRARACYEDQDLVVADSSGNSLVEVKDQDRDRPEIDRVQLRDLLLDAIPEGMIKWNHRVVSASAGTLTFTTHTEPGFDLIVGADGAWSKVRPLCTYVPAFYSGVTGVEMLLRNASSAHPEIGKMVPHGSLFCFGDEGHNLFFQRNSGDLIRAYAFGRRHENWIQDSGINWADPANIRAVVLKDYVNWAPELQSFIKDCDDDMQPRQLYMLPVGLTWPSQPNATLIGDAAHLMTPFSGEGVNMAMKDSLDLAQAIIKQPTNIAAAIAEYEATMWPRSTQEAETAWERTLSRFKAGAGQDFANHMKRALERRKQRS